MIEAYCKVNLILKVFPRSKAALKHRILSLFVLDKTLFDEVTVSEFGSNCVMYVVDDTKTKLEDCLVIRSIQYLQKKFKVKTCYRVYIKKHIDMMSGLGGGSSDAATVMLYIMKDNHIKLKELDMKDIALTLGSDIPFFLYGYETAIVEGYGDIVTPVELDRDFQFDYEVIRTGIKVPTKKVFDNLDQDLQYKSKVNFNKCYNCLLSGKFNTRYIYNDLQPYIFKTSPRLLDWYVDVPGQKKIVCGSGGSILTVK